MATRKFYIGDTYVDTGGSVGGMFPAQVAPHYAVNLTGVVSVITNTVGASREMAGGVMLNGYTAPQALGFAPLATLVTDTRMLGKFEAGTWTFKTAMGATYAGGPSPVSWHARVRFYRTNSLDSLSGTIFTHAVEIGSATAGTVATSNFQTVGYSTVTATLPAFNMANEYLLVFIGIILDVAPTVSTATLSPWLDQETYLQTSNFIPIVGDACVPSFVRRCPEAYEYHAPDGTVYLLDVPGLRFVTSSEGEGMPPINYNTQRGPFQHGVTLTDYFLQPRTVQLAIRHNYPNRDSLHRGRQELVGVLSPGLQSLTNSALQTGTLRKQLTSGELRDLRALILQGPNFNPRGTSWDEFAYTEVLRFQAFDPIWYDPTVNTKAFAAQGSQLVFGATFPITFTTLDSRLSVDYVGTWKAYPTFTVTGPTIGVLLQNDTTGDHIAVTYPLPAGRTMSISLQPGAKQVLLDDGTSLLGYVTDDSDLSAWHLTPQNDGVNELRAYATGVSSASRVSMTWLDAYLGV